MQADEILFVIALNNEVDLEKIGFTKATKSMQGDMSRRVCEVRESQMSLNVYRHTSGARLLITGIGKVNAAYALLDFLSENKNVKMVYNIGTAGGGLGVNAGDLLWCNKFVQYDMNATPQVKEEIGLTPYDDDALTPYLWNIVREIIKTVIENNQNLIVEGCYIPADWKQDFEQRYLTEIRFCCLCLSPKYIRTHFSDIIRHASDIELRLDDSECTADWLEKENSRYAVFCKKNNLPLITIETNYIEEIKALIPILTSGDIDTVRAEIMQRMEER